MKLFSMNMTMFDVRSEFYENTVQIRSLMQKIIPSKTDGIVTKKDALVLLVPIKESRLNA